MTVIREYKRQLEEFLSTQDARPSWDRHIPDKLCALITTLEDFKDFLDFVASYRGTDVLEFGCENTEEFLHRLPQKLESEHLRVRTEELGIRSDLGRLAYAMILSLGN